MIFRKILLFISVFLSFQCASFAEPVKTTLSHTKIAISESFNLTFTVFDNRGEKPDFSPLEIDFDILSCGQSHNTFITNGKVDQEIRWVLTLMPKRKGKLIIPPIQIGNDFSQAETIEVNESVTSKSQEPFFIETQLSPQTEMYEQTQLIFAIKVYLSANTAQAALSEVKVNDPDAIIEKLGNDRQYEEAHANGKRYMVLERKVAVFPHKIGELIFSPIIFEGRVVSGGNGFFQMQAPIKRVKSEEEKILVKQPPSPFQKNNWFAAQGLALKEEWSSDPSNLNIGEPVTWTLTVTAEGCLGNQIPNLALHIPPQLKSYPDKPQVSNQVKEDGFVGSKQIKVVLIPAVAGEITLPEIAINWWDLKAEEPRVAKLEEKIIQVRDGAIAMNSTPISSMIDEEKNLPKDFEQVSKDLSSDSHSLPAAFWYMVALNIFLVAVLGMFVFKRKFAPNPIKRVKRDFYRACKAGNAQLAAASLLTWAEIAYPQEKPLNLMKIRRFVPDAFHKALDALYEANYGKKTEWTEKKLWKDFKGFKKNVSSHTDKKREVLGELYPL